MSQPSPDIADLQARWSATRDPGEQVEVVLDAWERADAADSTRRRLGELARRFGQRLHATGVTSLHAATIDDCDAFLWTRTRRNAVPSPHTVQLRRTALRDLFRIAQLLDPELPDPTRALGAPAKPTTRPRPLTTDEITLLRTTALGRMRRPLHAAVIVALAETTATTGELPCLRWGDVDLRAGTVALAGAPPVNARAGTLTDWGTKILTRAMADVSSGDEGITGPSRGSTPYAAQAAMTSFLTRLLGSAGLAGPDVRPSSIRLWAGTQVLRDRGIEAAATALGFDSLDAAAAALDHQWRTQ